MRIFDFTDAIARMPGRSVVHGIRKDRDVVPAFERVAAEHTAYVEALGSVGLRVEVLPPLEEFPDSVFVEDPALVFSAGAVLLRPGTASRAGEGEHLRTVLRQRFKTVLELAPNFSADGGDVLTVPGGVFIGLSRRTGREGAEALSRLLRQLDLHATIVEPPPGSLHLKSAVSLLDEETLLASAAVAESGMFSNYRIVVPPPEEYRSAHALRINDVIFVPSHFPRTTEMLSKRGYDVAPLKAAEIRKLDAGLSCMSLRWFAAS
ncbi:MAG TPA: arginine deiminase family protein [Rhizomicrobium sp.]|nr:arginine deiminase family protein [Rhizomicrobium sp.]